MEDYNNQEVYDSTIPQQKSNIKIWLKGILIGLGIILIFYLIFISSDSDERFRVKILRTIALSNEDISFCEKIEIFRGKLNGYQLSEAGCMRDVAAKVGNISICERIGQIEPEDETSRINVPTVYENCVSDVASKLMDPNLCAEHHSEKGKEIECVISAAIKSNKRDLCEFLPNEEIKYECSDDQSFCMVGNPRNDCYKRVDRWAGKFLK